MERRQWPSVDVVVYGWKLHGGMHARFVGLILRNIVLCQSCQLRRKAWEIFVFSLQLRNPSPSPLYGCGAVLGQQQPWLQLDKHPPKSFEVQVSRGLGGSRFYHVRRLLVSALLYASMSGSSVPELPNGLLGGGG